METNYAKILSLELGIKENHAENIIGLLDDGCTIPFISRYRKEMTGSCDDQTLRTFFDRLTYLRNFDKRKEEVIKLITEQEKMTDEIREKIENANTLTELEDIYRPFRPKRQTRATIAISKGLEPLAKQILSQKDKSGDINEIAKPFISIEKKVETVEDAIKGALDIIAEIISDDADTRKSLREFIEKTAEIQTTLKEGENFKTYTMYDNYKEKVATIPSHRTLAINRGESDKCLVVKIVANEEKCLQIIAKDFIKGESIYTELMKSTIQDSFERLIMPSLDTEIRNKLTDTANEQAIKMFEVNLKPLLMQPPLKKKRILGLDPAYRTGCKLAAIDENGKVLATSVIYPTPPHNEIEKSELVVLQMIDKLKIDAISIGNGTASKESEIFVANLLKKCPRKVSYMVVSEAGASVYSASKLGAEEFPDYDVTQRSAVSIARRLQDPLAELIKIDVKSIGVGQYQHDMPQNRLTEVLEGVVEDCVNSVGVDLNTASPSLLSKVSGLNGGIAKNIVKYREENGAFENRSELKKVSKLGDKAFEQCAGFLRIAGGKNILDNTAVHPESYSATEKLLKLFKLKDEDIVNHNVQNLPSLIEDYGEVKTAEEIGIGVPTLQDIVKELLKPGRDIRDELPAPMLRTDVMDMKDLKEGMVMKGTVRNVIDFGAFIDIGVHQDGLVHISQICDRYIKHPSEELSVGQIVDVKILGVDLDKNRISLTMKNIDKA
ncbi:MAG: RNA-binding transcriptional accessory protein [Clostridiales bacterium]|nr:RNA-binding transcriptional accessory protein [Candidatus Apopatousia equi]